MKLERIIIAVDGSDNGAVAMDWAVEVAVRVDAAQHATVPVTIVPTGRPAVDAPA